MGDGLLSQLVNEKFQKERDATLTQISAYRSILGDTTATPEAKEYALDQLMSFAPGGKKAGQTLKPIFSKLLGIDKGGAGQGAPDPTQSSMIGSMMGQAAPKQTQAQGATDTSAFQSITGESVRPQYTAPRVSPAVPSTDPNERLIEQGVNQPTRIPGQPAQRPARFYMTPEEVQAQKLKFDTQEIGIKTEQQMKLRELADKLVTESDTKKRISLVREMKSMGATDDQILQGVYKVPRQAEYNLQRGFVKGPDGQPVAVRIDPRNPGNRVYEATNLPVPPDAVDVAAPTAYNDPNAPPKFGIFAQFYHSYVGNGMAPADARKYAGLAVLKQYGTTLSAKEQDIAIKSELSGIGGGPGFTSPKPAAAPAPTATLATTATPATSVTGAVGSTSAPTPTRTSATPKPPTGATNWLPSAKDQQLIDRAVTTILTNDRITPGSAAGLGIQKGLELYRKQTGLTPEQLVSAIKENAVGVKQLAFLGMRVSAYESIQAVLSAHGGLYLKALDEVTKEVGSDGVPLINKPVREIMATVGGSEKVAALRIALAAVSREYARMVSGGMTSNAMPPVSSAAEAEHIFSNGGQTLGMAIAAVKQLNLEADTERKALAERKAELLSHQGTSLASRVPGSAANQAGAGEAKAEDESWRKPKAKGTMIDLETAKKYITKFGSRAKGQVEAQKDGWIF